MQCDCLSLLSTAKGMPLRPSGTCIWILPGPERERKLYEDRCQTGHPERPLQALTLVCFFSVA